MFVFKDTRKRANIYAPYTAPDGTRHVRVPRNLLDEIADPTPPEDYSPETYFRTECVDAPYVIYTRKSEDAVRQVLAARCRDEALRHLEETDYLFTFDRHGELVSEEPERAANLKASRETARNVIRDYRQTYGDSL